MQFSPTSFIPYTIIIIIIIPFLFIFVDTENTAKYNNCVTNILIVKKV
jgi:hypothetical protein